MATIQTNLQQELKPLVPAGAGGIVAIYHPGSEPQFIALGSTAVTNGQSVNKDTLTLVASTSKMFVGLLAVRLAQLGILSLDTELSQVMDHKYFAIFAEPQIAEHITLRQILSHTSGLQYDADCERSDRAGQDLNQIVNTMTLTAERNHAYKIRFTNNPKDKIYSYSNQIWLATIFIEKSYNDYLQAKDGLKHNLNYADILQQQILQPLNMTRTGFQKSKNDLFSNDQNKLQAYVEQRGVNPAYSYEFYTFDPTHRAVGGLWTTAADLMKLAAALTVNGLHGKDGQVLIDKQHIQQLITPQGINGNVGLGVYNENQRVGKGGSLSSFGSNFEIDSATGNAVASLINFRPTVPVKFDARALLALDDLGSSPRPKQYLSSDLKNKLRSAIKQAEKLGIEQYANIYTSKFGYIGVNKLSNGLIMNWNGYTLAAGKIAPNRYLIFDDPNRSGTEVTFGVGPNSHNTYLLFENGNDNSQAFKPIPKAEVIPKNITAAYKLINDLIGSKGKTYTGTRPDGAGSVSIKVDQQLGKIIAQSEGPPVPIIITKVLSNNTGNINEIWLMGNHFIVPDKLTKLINKNGSWLLAIAISDNPDVNVEYLSATD